MLFQPVNAPLPFRQWVFRDPENKRLLLFSAVVIVLQMVWFKIELPYPNFVQETYSYLEAAANNDFVGKLPIGYSKYLQLVGLFGHSTLLPVVLQYLFLEAAVLYFFLSMRQLLSPGKWLLRILLAFTVLNPLLLKVSNLLTADALFAGFSLVWFTQLLWLLYKPGTRLWVAHAFVLLFAFALRDIAVYYIAVSIAVVLLAPTRARAKLGYTVFILLLLAVFVGGTQYAYQQHTGTVQLSAGRGWQAANNALYAYAHVPQDTGKDVSYKFRKVQALVNHYDSVKYRKHGADASIGNFYIEDKASPLYAYVKTDSSRPAIQGADNRWLLMGPFYKQYADWLLEHHRGAYYQYFVLPNVKNYFVPDPEYAGYYFPFGITDSAAIRWFHLPSRRLFTYQNDSRIAVVNYVPGLLALSGIVFLLGFVAFAVLSGFSKTGVLAQKLLVCALSVEVLHLVFSVSQAPVVLRYQVFPFVLLYSFGVLFLAFLVQESKSRVSNIRPVATGGVVSSEL